MYQNSLRHPANVPKLLMQMDFYEICDRDTTAMMILSLLEYWYDRKRESLPQVRQKNAIAVQHGDEPAQDESLLQWHSEEALEYALMGHAKRDRIREAIRLLGDGDPEDYVPKIRKGKTEPEPRIIGKGFIKIRSNPNPRYSFDRTRYFQLNLETIQAALDAHCPDGQWPEWKPDGRAAENRSRQTEKPPSSSCNITTNTIIEVGETKSEIRSVAPNSQPISKPIVSAADEQRQYRTMTTTKSKPSESAKIKSPHPYGVCLAFVEASQPAKPAVDQVNIASWMQRSGAADSQIAAWLRKTSQAQAAAETNPFAPNACPKCINGVRRDRKECTYCDGNGRLSLEKLRSLNRQPERNASV